MEDDVAQREDSLLYGIIARLLAPALWWGRVRVVGAEVVPAAGAVLLVPNHDSQMDPLMVGLALRRRRPVRFLARANLWKIPGLGAVLGGMRQIPIERGSGDDRALERAIEALRAGDAICIFPEGKLSHGERLKARSGVARLWSAHPAARVVLCGVDGATDYVRFPRRPRVTITFFEPRNGLPEQSEEPSAMAERLMDEIRALVPPAPAGRRMRARR